MKKKSAAKKTSIALVGAGAVAKKHMKAIAYLEKRGLANLVALVDTNEEAANNLRSKSSAHIFSDLTSCLESTRPDLLALTTPSGTHADLAEQALNHGCHVLIEKPMTLSLPEADKLLALAEEKDKKIAVGHIYRYLPLAESLHALATDGRLGRCLYGDVKVRWGHDQAYYDQADWRGTYAADGGVLMNQTIHAIDLMQWLIDEKAIESVAMLARQSHDMEAEDLALGVVRFTNNIYLQVEGTTNTDPAKHEASFTLFFEKGEIRVSLSGGSIHVSIAGRDVRKRASRTLLISAIRSTIGREGLSIVRHLSNPHTSLYLDTVRAIQAGREPLANGKSGRDALATVLSLYRAAKERLVVSLASTVAFPLSDMIGVLAVNPTASHDVNPAMEQESRPVLEPEMAPDIDTTSNATGEPDQNQTTES